MRSNSASAYVPILSQTAAEQPNPVVYTLKLDRDLGEEDETDA